MFRNRLFKSFVLALGGIVAMAGIAFAAWTVSGSGNGGATATVAQSLTFNPIQPTGAAANLYPGGVSAAWFTVTNPNPFAVTVTGITWGTPTSNNTTSCPNSNVAIDPSAPTTVSLSIPANSTSGAFSVGGVLDMLHTAPNGCEGVSFNIPIVSATATQQ